MNKQNLALGVIVLVIGLIVGYAIHGSSSSQTLGSTSCGSITCLSGGLRLVTGAGGDFESDVAAIFSSTFTHSTTGTTTNVEISSSATQGFCQQFNATSTNTLLNITYAATTSTATQASGVTGVVRYGTCN